jgi:hypothetical protein
MSPDGDIFMNIFGACVAAIMAAIAGLVWIGVYYVYTQVIQ